MKPDTITLQVPAGTKGRWVRAAAGQKLTAWLLARVEGPPAEPITPAQFEALAGLLKMRTGPAKDVAYQVLVNQLQVPAAAQLHGLEYTAASQAVRRARRGLAQAWAAAAAPVAQKCSSDA